MRRTLISVVLTLGLLFAPSALAVEATEPSNSWFVRLQEVAKDIVDTILFWTEDPQAVSGEIPGMPEPLG